MTTACGGIISRLPSVRPAVSALAVALALGAPASAALQDRGQGVELVRIQFLGVQGWVPAVWIPGDQADEGYPLRNHPELHRHFTLPGEDGVAELHIDAQLPDPEVGIEELVERRSLLEPPQLVDQAGQPVEARVTRLTAGRSSEIPVIVAEARGAGRRRVGGDWEAVPDLAWIRALVRAPGGVVVMKLEGLAATVAANREAFDRFLGGLETGVAPSVVGRLVEAGTGRPLPGEVMVSQTWSVGPESVTSGDRVQTRADGTFAIYDRPYGPHRLGGVADNHGRGYHWVFIDSAETPNVEIALPVAGAIRGVVVDTEGLPRSRVRVELLYERGTRPPEVGRRAVVARARAEGHRAFWTSSDRRSSTTHGLGELVFLDIDPDRPFHLELSHAELGEVTTEVMTLASGEVIDGLRIVIGRGPAARRRVARAPH
jgi:hypothetical protein